MVGKSSLLGLDLDFPNIRLIVKNVENNIELPRSVYRNLINLLSMINDLAGTLNVEPTLIIVPGDESVSRFLVMMPVIYARSLLPVTTRKLSPERFLLVFPFTFSVDSFDIYPLPEFVNHPYLLYDVDRGMYFPIGETTMVTAMDVKRVSTLRRLLSYLSRVSPFREITADRGSLLLLEEMGLSPYYPLYLVLEPIIRLVKMFRVLTPELLVVAFYSPFNLSAENISVSDETYLKRWKPWELDVNAEVRGGRVKILDDYVMLALAKLSSKYPEIGDMFIIEGSRNVEGGSSLGRLVDSLAGDLEEAVQTLLEAYRMIRSVRPSVKLVIE